MKEQIGTFDIFVSKLVQKSGKILSRDELLRIWIVSGGSQGRFSYAVTQAKNQGYMLRLMSDIFFIGAPLDNLDDLYWQMIGVLIKTHSPSGAIVSGEKSMECYLRNFSIPDVLILYTRDTARRVRLYHGREVHFRTIKSGEKKGGKNMFRLLEKHSAPYTIDEVTLDILSLEASLLDMASLRIHESGLSEVLLEKFLGQHEKKLSREKLGELVSYRYIRAANRLRKFAQDRGFSLLYEQMLDVIKREGGGCFLNL